MMIKLTRTIAAVAALGVSLLCGVLGTFSIAVGSPVLTAALVAGAAATAALAFALGRTT